MGDSLKITATVDTFSIGSQQTARAQQPVLPVTISALLTGDSLTTLGDSVAGQCNPLFSTVITDLHNIFARFPDTLSTGITWRDSTDITSCQATIPMQSHTVRTYRVTQQTAYEGVPAVIVLRTDTIRAHGEGVQGQHQIKLDATGTGAATYFLDPAKGEVLHLSVDQALDLTVTSAEANTRLRQVSRQDFSLVR